MLCSKCKSTSVHVKNLDRGICLNGHLVCADCNQGNFQNCPVCGEKIDRRLRMFVDGTPKVLFDPIESEEISDSNDEYENYEEHNQKSNSRSSKMSEGISNVSTDITENDISDSDYSVVEREMIRNDNKFKRDKFELIDIHPPKPTFTSEEQISSTSCPDQSNDEIESHLIVKKSLSAISFKPINNVSRFKNSLSDENLTQTKISCVEYISDCRKSTCNPREIFIQTFYGDKRSNKFDAREHYYKTMTQLKDERDQKAQSKLYYNDSCRDSAKSPRSSNSQAQNRSKDEQTNPEASKHSYQRKMDRNSCSPPGYGYGLVSHNQYNTTEKFPKPNSKRLIEHLKEFRKATNYTVPTKINVYKNISPPTGTMIITSSSSSITELGEDSNTYSYGNQNNNQLTSNDELDHQYGDNCSNNPRRSTIDAGTDMCMDRPSTVVNKNTNQEKPSTIYTNKDEIRKKLRNQVFSQFEEKTEIKKRNNAFIAPPTNKISPSYPVPNQPVLRQTNNQSSQNPRSRPPPAPQYSFHSIKNEQRRCEEVRRTRNEIRSKIKSEIDKLFQQNDELEKKSNHFIENPQTLNELMKKSICSSTDSDPKLKSDVDDSFEEKSESGINMNLLQPSNSTYSQSTYDISLESSIEQKLKEKFDPCKNLQVNNTIGENMLEKSSNETLMAFPVATNKIIYHPGFFPPSVTTDLYYHTYEPPCVPQSRINQPNHGLENNINLPYDTKNEKMESHFPSQVESVIAHRVYIPLQDDATNENPPLKITQIKQITETSLNLNQITKLALSSNIDRSPITCPISLCRKLIFISDFTKHIKIDHSKIPIESITPGKHRNIFLDPRIDRVGVNKCQMLYLVTDKILGLGNSAYKNYLPLMLMTTRFDILHLYNPELIQPSGDQFLMIWLTGFYPNDMPLCYSITAWTRNIGSHNYVCHLVHSGKLYSLRNGQDSLSLYSSGQALLMSEDELKILSNGGQNMIEIQILVH